MSFGEQISTEEQNKQISQSIETVEHLNDFAAGCFGGCAGLIFGHPFDTIKVRQQTFPGHISVKQCAQQTLLNEGVKGFFKGLAFPLAAVGLLNSIFFGVYGYTLHILNDRRHGDPKLDPLYRDIFLAGGIAGAVQAIPACPIELVKVKLQVQKEKKTAKGLKYHGPGECMKYIYRNGGMRACFRGLEATILREITGFSVYITSYKYLCDEFTEYNGHKEASIPTMLLAGGFAGMLSWMVNIPMDIIKNRLQVDDIKSPKYKGTMHCIRHSLEADGWKVFWRGLPVTCFRAFPVNAVTFTIYSSTLRALKKVEHLEE